MAGRKEGGWDSIGVPPSVHMYVYTWMMGVWHGMAWHGMLHTVP